MINPLKTPWADWKYNIEIDKYWIPDIDKDFLHHCIPILGAIPLKRLENGKISPSLTYANLTDISVNTPNGSIAGSVIQDMLSVLYDVNRSSWIKGAMTKNALLGSLTPLPMYAQKLHNNVKYEEWSKTDTHIGLFLGKALSNGFKNLPENRGEYTKENILKNRILALTKKASPVMGNITSYVCCSRSFIYEEGKAVPLGQFCLRMVLQLWIANASIRKPDAMILDPWNWDATPEALDACIASAPIEQTDEPLPWK